MGRVVLCIEDNPDNMMLFRRVLEASGFVVRAAFNGLDGLQIAENEPVDIVLLDINLPDIDGYEVTRRLRHSANLKAACLPILIITANVQKQDVEQAMAAGATEFITKPIDIFALCDRVEEYLSACQ
ncbi:MAG: response regulator [Anaerolineales bacterium]|nr:response regulator [Anaerolineales bacterium]MCX7755812.1 response regulator [Anaerolineales bacterium]MDW8278371.1 response regulator [Anaerolineales bacterium]